MEAHERVRLAEIMAAIAAGDDAAVFTLVEEFDGPLRAAVRRAGERLGVRLGAEELDQLVTDAALALLPVAGSWRPDGGALPWVWGAARVLQAVSAHVGQHHDLLDETTVERALRDDGPDGVPAHDVAVREVLAGTTRPELLALRDVAERLGWEQAEVWLEYECQAAAGDPSPAATVGDLYGLQPAAVRKRVERTRRRFRALVAEDASLGALAASPLVA